MIEINLILAVFLLILGIIGSIIPALPGPILSILGALLYWRSTGFSTPDPIFLFLIISTGVLALIIDIFSSFYGAKKGRASRSTAYKAAIASIILLPFTGPFGIIIGTVGVVLTREIMLGKNLEEAAKTAFYTTLAILGSTIVKVGLTTFMLILFIISVILT